MPAINKLSKTCIALSVSQILLSSANAATITITSNTDATGSPACSLREAIALINTPPVSPVSGDCQTNVDITEAFGTNDTINFDFLVSPNTITLEEGALSIFNPLKLMGPGQDQLSIDGNKLSKVFLMASQDISISDLTITGGSTAGAGGGIDANVNIVISRCTITGNTADSLGGGIALGTGALISDSLITNNFGGFGGGINMGGSRLENSVVSNNTSTTSGGGIRMQQVIGATIIDSVVSGNTSGFNGGGVYALTAEKIDIVNSTIEQNSASNSGGGITFRGGQGDQQLNIIASTLSGNSAGSNGGGFHSYSDNTATITNSTLSDNTARFNGGGIGAGDTNNLLTLTNVTIFGNHSPGIGGVFNSAGVVTGRNNVVANSTTDDCNTAIFASDPADNWSEDGTCTNEAGEGDPQLGPLEDNGGPTLTHIPLPGSGLIDAGSGFVCMNSPVNSVDQRGEPRGARRSSDCFIGAVEGIKDDGTFFVIPVGNNAPVIINL